MQKKHSRPLWILIGLALLIGLYNLPPIHSRLSWRVDNLRTQIEYYFNPPEEDVFQPSTPEPTTAITQTFTPTATPEGVINTPIPTLTPTIIPTAYPQASKLSDVIYVDQENRWNYCGPSNLAMSLIFWDWEGNRDDIAKIIKPGIADEKLDFIQRGKTDKNVMPYEMVDFVNEQTEFRALSRLGGEMDLLKNFIAAGFPVMVEKGYYARDTSGQVSWMGHYQFVTGYNDAAGYFIVQDTYDDGPNFHANYEQFLDDWRWFNNLFMVVYPPEREEEVFSLLGTWVNETWASQHALDIAETEIETLNDELNQFTAWFSKGTSLAHLQRYAEAAEAYDQAFILYANLEQFGEFPRPYRIVWYQTEPYWAYFSAGRYEDVIALATKTLTFRTDPILEESLYWRALAEYSLGNYVNAYADMREAVRLNPHFYSGLFYLELWGAN